MRPVPVSYRLDNPTAGRQVLESTAQQFAHHRLTGGTRTTLYYDTFDWRAFRRDTFLRAHFEHPSKVLTWVRTDGQEIQRVPITERPGFVWDLPAGALREGLEPVLEMRRLLPLFSVEAQTETLHVLDSRRKTVARARLETITAHPAQGDGGTANLPVVIRAIPIRGYDKDFATLCRLLDEKGLEPLVEDEFTLATTAIGLQPAGYTRKLDLRLDPAERSDEALRTILKRLLQVIQQNEPGVRSNLDSEFVHDFRVAVRRTRSALSQLKGVLPPEAVAHFKTEFSWLGKITGPTRDLDVYLLKMPLYRASLPAHLGADLDPLNEFLLRHQQIEHRDLVELLNTQRYQSLLANWRSFLEQPFSEDSERPEAATPILALASRRIWHSWRRVLKKGTAIDSDSPAAALHRLRIECKKLRYLLEFFRSLYPDKQMQPLIDALKRLQDNLGDFNDLEIQQETLKQFAQTMLAEKIGTGSSLMAMGRLVERLEHRQTEERQIFHKRFARFANRQNRQRFKTLFKPSETQQA